MTIARERILREAQRPQAGHSGEHVARQGRDVVVVECPTGVRFGGGN